MEDGSGEGPPSATAWWAGGAYREALQADRGNQLTSIHVCTEVTPKTSTFFFDKILWVKWFNLDRTF